MSNYTGSTCPVCHKPFTPTDDIVVCPDCGTPYHRACWPADGVCVNAARHGAGFEWKPDNAEDDGQLACPNCGARNPAGTHFCSHCGVPLPEHPENVDAPHSSRTSAPGGSGRPIYDDPDYTAPQRNTDAPPHINTYTVGPEGGTVQFVLFDAVCTHGTDQTQDRDVLCGLFPGSHLLLLS